MEYQDYIRLGLNGDAPLKVILCGSIESEHKEKIGVVSLVYATMNKAAAEKKLDQLVKENPDNYYMVYSVPLDIDLTELSHYPSIAISREDLEA